jgi:hypothetical protein
MPPDWPRFSRRKRMSRAETADPFPLTTFASLPDEERLFDDRPIRGLIVEDSCAELADNDRPCGLATFGFWHTRKEKLHKSVDY